MWWDKGRGGKPTVNEERNRDVVDFWKAAQEASIDVSAQLREVRGDECRRTFISVVTGHGDMDISVRRQQK